MAEIRIYEVVSGTGNVSGHLADLLLGEKQVGRDRYHGRAGAYRSQQFIFSSLATAGDVVRIDGPRQRVVGVDIKTPAELLTLITLVGSCPQPDQFCAGVGVVLRLVVSLLPAVAQQRDRTCCGKALHCGVGAVLSELRIALDGHPLRLVEGYCPRCDVRQGGYEDEVFGKVGLLDDPFAALVSADRTADEQLDPFYSEMLGQKPVTAHHVADGDERERVVIGLACFGIDTQRAGSSVTRTEEVGTDGEVAGRIEELALLDGVLPPLCHIRICRERMAHPDDVVATAVHLTEGVVCYGE